MLNLHLLECTLKGYDHISDLLLAKYWVITGCKYLICSSLEIVHLPAGVSNFEIYSFKDCPNLKAIYAPKNKVDFYKEHFPADMHWLIVEDGSDLPVKP